MVYQTSYLKQVDSWRDELVEIGKFIDDDGGPGGWDRIKTRVQDLRCRVAQVCRELDIRYDDDDPISTLIRKILEKVSD